VKRHLLNLLAWLSLLVCLAIAVIGLRSYYVGSRTAWSRFIVKGDCGRDGNFELLSSGGGLSIRCSFSEWMPVRPGSFRFDAGRPAQWEHYSIRPALPYPNLETPPVDVQRFRLAWRWNDYRKGTSVDVKVTELGIVVPYWLLVLVALAFPTWWAVRAKQRRMRTRLANVQCISCGYDLRATPDRCPERGAVPHNAAPAA
jgi:hypothetical protein